ncbi:platelet-activating factor acetylhydrolase, isoform II-domain-containing protein, partial [Coniella lustricola]
PPPHSPPPKTWRERIFHSLPSYAGPYSVGYLELELPANNPRQDFSDIRRHSQNALHLDTVLFSIYYPTNDDGSEKQEKPALVRVPWLPRPRLQTCHGYAKFLRIPNPAVTAYMAATCMFTKLPAWRNAVLAQERPCGPAASKQVEEAASDAPATHLSDQQGATAASSETLIPGPDQDSAGQPRFPVVVFSHGLGGSRTMYSTICGDLASYGFVVVAMEHRDGSGARTYVNHCVDEEGDLEPTANSRSENTKQDREQPQRARHYMVDYIFPKDNAQDTAPHNAKGVDRELRGAQIEMRLAEIEEAFAVLQLINNGDPHDIIRKRNLRKKPNRGSSSRGLIGIDWSDWQGRLSLQNVTAMGHSFGGATTVQILRLDDRFHWVGQGILLDAWGPATPEVPHGSEQTITKPLLSIGSEAFMHWKDNYDKVTQICSEAQTGSGLCWMLTVKGSTHLSQTDFSVLYPRWMSLFMKTLINPLRGIYLTVAPTLEFLKIVLPPAQTTTYDTSGWVDDGLLRQAKPADEISLDHKPDEKWIAARLKIRHEFRRRLQSWWKRATLSTYFGRWKRTAIEDVPRDKEGNLLFGLGTWGPGEEMWVHMCPK